MKDRSAGASFLSRLEYSNVSNIRQLFNKPPSSKARVLVRPFQAVVEFLILPDFGHFIGVREFRIFNVAHGGCLDKIGQGPVFFFGKFSKKPVMSVGQT
jgi:hypothetical protein